MIDHNVVFNVPFALRIMQDFEVSGGYRYGGRSGTFQGLLRIHDDNRLVGAMNDEGKDIIYNLGKTKIVMGTIEKGKMNFWKFSPSQFTAPLLYALNEDGEAYKGRWCAFDLFLAEIARGTWGNKGIPEIINAMKQKNLEKTLTVLSEIEKDRILSYLPAKIVENVLNSNESEGYLKMDPIRTLIA